MNTLCRLSLRLVAVIFLLSLLIGPTPVTAQSTNYPIYLPIIQKLCVPQSIDDFSDPSSGWRAFTDADVQEGYTNGEYQILVKTVDPSTHTRAAGVQKVGFQLEDYSVQVDVRNVNGQTGAYGLMFGISSDFNELYSFTIFSSGEYSLDLYNGTLADPWTSIYYSQTPSPAVLTGTATNRLRVDRVGTSIKLYANGTLLNTFTDAAYTGSRGIGLEADAIDLPNLDVRFDNFTIYPSTCIP